MSTLMMIPPQKIKIDHSYQRPLDQHRASAIGAAYDPVAAGAVYVSDRTGTRDDALYAFDGQQRTAGALIASVDLIPAIVHDGMTVDDEAREFVRVNATARRPMFRDVFRAMVQAHDPTALGIVSTAASCGVVLDLGHSMSAHSGRADSCRAVGAVYNIADGGSLELLAQTLTVLRQAWPNERLGLSETCVVGVASVLYTYGTHPKFSVSRLVDRLAVTPPSQVVRRSRELGAVVSSGTKDTAGKAIRRFLKPGPREAVLEIYNWRLQSKLPSPTLRDYRALNDGRNPWIAS